MCTPLLFGAAFFFANIYNQVKQTNFMHEVKVYDGSGNLKEVISVKKLNLRSKQQIESPSLFLKNKKVGKQSEKDSETQEKSETP